MLLNDQLPSAVVEATPAEPNAIELITLPASCDPIAAAPLVRKNDSTGIDIAQYPARLATSECWSATASRLDSTRGVPPVFVCSQNVAA